MKKTFSTKLVGITQTNKDGIDIQKIIENYVLENYDSNTFDKEDSMYHTNSDIKEDGYEVYKYWLTEKDTIKLVAEPENPHDPNAIMVVHDKMGKIGYIPRTDNVELAKFLEEANNNVKITINLDGGPYKIYDEDQEKIIKKDDKPFYFKIYIDTKKSKKTKNQKTKYYIGILCIILALYALINKKPEPAIVLLIIGLLLIKKHKTWRNKWQKHNTK